MTTTGSEDWAFTVTSGATGHFSFRGSLSNPSGAYDGTISGTFNGHAITGLSSFGNPTEAVSDDASPEAQGLTAYPSAFYQSGPNDKNGFSFTLDDQSSVHLYLVQTGPDSYSLRYETSTGQGGPITLSHTGTIHHTNCFAAGTGIATPCGIVAVERLGVGDRVLTQAGEARVIRWVGRTIVHPERSSHVGNLRPVRIGAHAFALDSPARDLLLSPGHAVAVDGHLISIVDLVNGATVTQERADQIAYHHIELDSHDVILADGLPCETYLDDGNRSSFLGGTDPFRLHGRIDGDAPGRTCLPFARDGLPLRRARERLLRRALAMGWRLEGRHDLRLTVGAAELRPVAVVGSRYWFALPDPRGEVRIVAHGVKVERVRPWVQDGRTLAAAIGELRIDGRLVPLSSDCLRTGFFPVEEEDGRSWRWFDGDAVIAHPDGMTMIEITLQHVAPRLYRDDAPAVPAAVGLG